MNIITVFFNNNPQIAQFHFDKYDDADRAVNKLLTVLPSEVAHIEDDYGSKGHFTTSSIAGITLTDLIRELLAQEQIELAKTRNQIKVQKAIQHDPSNRLAMPSAGH